MRLCTPPGLCLAVCSPPLWSAPSGTRSLCTTPASPATSRARSTFLSPLLIFLLLSVVGLLPLVRRSREAGEAYPARFQVAFPPRDHTRGGCCCCCRCCVFPSPGYVFAQSSTDGVNFAPFKGVTAPLYLQRDVDVKVRGGAADCTCALHPCPHHRALPLVRACLIDLRACLLHPACFAWAPLVFDVLLRSGTVTVNSS